MKLKIFVAFVLFVTVFLIGSIFLIAFFKSPAFVYLYFIFSLLLFIAVSASMKMAYPEEIKLSFVLIIAIFIAIALTFFGNSVKTYYEKNKEITSNLDSNSQIVNIEAKNQYYTEYINFLGTEILNIKQASLDLQNQIDNFIAQQNTANQAVNTQNNTPIIIYEDEEEEDD